MERQVVFVVGMPRSGSTLVEQILSSHRGVRAGGERTDLPRIIDRIPAVVGPAAEYPECLREVEDSVLDGVRKSYLESISATGARDTDDLLFVDKTLGLYLELGLICILFPDAKIIHCTRNARDTCISCYFQNFSHIRYANDLAMLGAVYNEYNRMMAHWKRSLPSEICEVEYESLVGSPEAVVRRVLDYCGLPWDAACLEFHRTKRAVHTASAFQVKTPIYSTSVGRWRHYKEHLSDLIATVG